MARTPQGKIELYFRSFTGYYWKIAFLHYTRYWPSTYGKPLLADEPVTWETNGSENLTTSVRGCSGTVNLVVDGKNITRERFNQFFNTQDLTDLRIEVYRSIERKDTSYYKYPIFQGFVKTEEAEQPLQPYPYSIQLTILDALSAGDYIRPANFMERCVPLHYRFSMKNLLEWWMEDMDITHLDVFIQEFGSNLELPRLYTSDFMDITENANMKPQSVIRAPTYNEIFSKVIGTNRMYFKSNQIEIHRNKQQEGDHITRWCVWESDNGVLKTSDGRSFNPQILKDHYAICGSEHSCKRIPARSTQYTYSNLRKEDVSLGIDFTRNRDIKGQKTEDGYLWGQGNLISHGDVGMMFDKKITVETSSFKASLEEINGWLVIGPNNGEESIMLRTVKPVCYGAVDKLLLSGRLVQRIKDQDSFADKPVYRTENDYVNVLEYSLQWGDFYSTGGASGRNGWSTSENKNSLKMVKDYLGSDTSNFYDIKTDPMRNESTAYAKMFECEDNGVSNYEGIHFFSPPRIINGADPRDCGHIILRIYGAGTSWTNISGLSLKSVNEDTIEYSYGDIVDGDEIDCPDNVISGESIWSASGNPSVSISKYSELRIFNIIHGLIPMLYDSSTFYSIVGWSFNPRNEVGDLHLLSY